MPPTAPLFPRVARMLTGEPALPVATPPPARPPSAEDERRLWEARGRNLREEIRARRFELVALHERWQLSSAAELGGFILPGPVDLGDPFLER